MRTAGALLNNVLLRFTWLPLKLPRSRASCRLPGRNTALQSFPLQATGSIPVTKFEDPSIALLYVEKKRQPMAIGRRAKTGILMGAKPARAGLVSVGL